MQCVQCKCIHLLKNKNFLELVEGLPLSVSKLKVLSRPEGFEPMFSWVGVLTKILLEPVVIVHNLVSGVLIVGLDKSVAVVVFMCFV